MKKLTHEVFMLSAMSFVAIVLVSSCVSKNTNRSISLQESSSDYSIAYGKIVTEAFEDKGGRVHPEIVEYYFQSKDKQYFIKFSECSFAGEIKEFNNTFVKVHSSIKNGSWDSDDPMVQSRIGEYVVLSAIEKVEIPEKIVISDDNGNTYILIENQIEYDPITPAESSSGEYDGGSPKKSVITIDQFMNIYFLAEELRANKNILLNQRLKPSAQLNVYNKSNTSSVIVKPCDELNLFLKTLNLLVGR